MKKLALVLLVVASTSCRTTHQNASETLFSGYDTLRAEMEISDGYFFMTDLPAEVLNDPEQFQPLLNSAFRSHIQHLFGVLKGHPEFADKNKAAPQLDPTVTIKQIEQNVEFGGKKWLKVSYSYRDTGQFKKKYLKDGPKIVKVLLPTDMTLARTAFGLDFMPIETYSAGMVPGTDADGNPQEQQKCSDPKYDSIGDYWYFWNPFKEGCPEAVTKLLASFDLKLKPIPNKPISFPQYERLFEDGLKVFLIQGTDHEDLSNREDYGWTAFGKTQQLLRENGFVPSQEISERHRVYTKSTSFGLEVSVDVYLDYPGADSFVDHVRAAMQQADLFVYSGHSGLGGHMPPYRFAPLDLGNKYQIFFFNGCSTYSYYNRSYFDIKPGGPKNLDVLTNGVAGYFAVNAYAVMSLLNDLTSGEHRPYQKIVENIYEATSKAEASNLDKDKHSPNIAVNGDEGNPIEEWFIVDSPDVTLSNVEDELHGTISLTAAVDGTQRKYFSTRAFTGKDPDTIVQVVGIPDGPGIYGLTKTGRVFYFSNQYPWVVRESVMSFKYDVRFSFLYHTTVEEREVVYAIGTDGKLYFKEESSGDLKVSARQPPVGVSFVRVGFGSNGEFYGESDAGRFYQWVPDERGFRTATDRVDFVDTAPILSRGGYLKKVLRP